MPSSVTTAVRAPYIRARCQLSRQSQSQSPAVVAHQPTSHPAGASCLGSRSRSRQQSSPTSHPAGLRLRPSLPLSPLLVMLYY
ncbi:hypothetical protein Y032_0194g1441 [Ancylostoma ceylanicum]|uniref:Uncharacterized protein n=1 Tax=Ancylostoma ceylanicum TaxID=53326 RepID=A0A016SPX1_9BILA|nr:hypothetical protein Y032_0194g1441 [Ancylostoma ceylanicum]